jgi:hypothetical protein
MLSVFFAENYIRKQVATGSVVYLVKGGHMRTVQQRNVKFTFVRLYGTQEKN